MNSEQIPRLGDAKDRILPDLNDLFRKIFGIQSQKSHLFASERLKIREDDCSFHDPTGFWPYADKNQTIAPFGVFLSVWMFD